MAACVTLAGVASLPFVGGLGPSTSLVATGPAPTSTTIAPPPPPPPTTAPPLPAPAPREPTAVEAPPIDVSDLAAGVGAGPAVVVPVALTPAAPAARIPAPSPSPTPAVAPRSAADLETHPERIWAVTIGIDDYPGGAYDLGAAVADARTVTDTLLSYGVPGGHILEVLDGRASVDGILGAVDWLVANTGPEDTAVLFYAGHVRDLGGGTEVLVTTEGGWIADWFLADRLAPLQARDAWLVIAACFGGGFQELLAPGRVMTAAAPAGELAYESPSLGRSYLAEYLFLRGLHRRGAAEPTVQSSVAWAMARLAEEHPDHQLWNEDRAGHTVSIDGARRGEAGTAPPAPPPPGNDPGAPPPTTVPPPSDRCLVVLRCR